MDFFSRLFDTIVFKKNCFLFSLESLSDAYAIFTKERERVRRKKVRKIGKWKVFSFSMKYCWKYISHVCNFSYAVKKKKFNFFVIVRKKKYVRRKSFFFSWIHENWCKVCLFCRCFFDIWVKTSGTHMYMKKVYFLHSLVL